MRCFELHSNSQGADEIKGLPISISFRNRSTELLILFSIISTWLLTVQNGADVGENLINTEDSVPIVISTDTTVNSFVKGYHAYKDLWKTLTNKELTTVMEPNKCR